MKIYMVMHDYGVDGGFGDYIRESECVGTFECREDAEAFIKRFAKPHVYDVPYDDLDCGSLRIEETVVMPKGCNMDAIDSSEFWWLTNDVIETNEKKEDL